MNLARLVFLLVISAPTLVEAATLTVEKDGFGQFSLIQDAVNSAAPGDTILVGPGRYDTFASFQISALVVQTIVGIETGPLVIRGTDASQVIIGPEVANNAAFGPQGMAVDITPGTVSVENLTFENMFDGIISTGEMSVVDCVFRGCEQGISGFSVGSVDISSCVFEDNELGIVTFAPSQNITVRNSVFTNNDCGISYAQTPNANTYSCQFSGGVSGVQLEQGTVGSVQDCSFVGASAGGILVTSDADATILRNSVTGGTRNLGVLVSHCQGSGNVFNGGSFATITLDGGATADLHGNHILRTQGLAINTSSYVVGPITIDLTGNYWGTSEPDSIAAWIHDSNDDSSILATVDFSGFLVDPVVAAPLVPTRLLPTIRVFPNPLNPVTTISLDVPRATNAELSIVDLRGRFVATLWTGALASGMHSFSWRGIDESGRAVASGVYLATLRSGEGYHVTEKLALVR